MKISNLAILTLCIIAPCLNFATATDAKPQFSQITTVHMTFNQASYLEHVKASFDNQLDETDTRKSVDGIGYLTTIDDNLPAIRTRGNQTIYTFDGVSKNDVQSFTFVNKEFTNKHQCEETAINGFLSTSCVFTNN